jgi:hypothetical protein
VVAATVVPAAGYLIEQATDRGLLLAPVAPRPGTVAYQLWDPVGVAEREVDQADPEYQGQHRHRMPPPPRHYSSRCDHQGDRPSVEGTMAGLVLAAK